MRHLTQAFMSSYHQASKEASMNFQGLEGELTKEKVCEVINRIAEGLRTNPDAFQGLVMAVALDAPNMGAHQVNPIEGASTVILLKTGPFLIQASLLTAITQDLLAGSFIAGMRSIKEAMATAEADSVRSKVDD